VAVRRGEFFLAEQGLEQIPSDQWRLTTFGGLSIRSTGGAEPSAAATRRQSLALLAFIAAANSGLGVSRDRLCAVFWPESDSERARNALKQAIFALRRDLKQPDLVVGSGELRLNPTVICSDVADFNAALAAKDLDRAAGIYAGSFLEGVHLRAEQEFERWAETERSRLAELADMAMRSTARAALTRNDIESAVRWWRRVVALNPLDATATLDLLRSLELRGDKSGAAQHARVYSSLVRQELGTDPDPRVEQFVKKLSEPSVTPGPNVASSSSTPRSRPPAESPQTNLTAASAIPTSIAGAAASPHRLTAGRTVAAAASLVVLALIVWYARRPSTTRIELQPTSSTVFIAPFNVDASDSSLAFLHDGMIDLLRSAFSGDSLSPRVVETAAGATHVVRGEVVHTRGDVFLDANVYDAHAGRIIGKATASGSVDSLPHLVDQLAAQLIAIQAGERSVTADVLSGTPLAAVKEYLAGRIAFRRGAYENAVLHQKLALLTDSTFALAAIELGRTAGWLGDDGSRRWAYERAWSNRKKLGPLDRALVVATLGPNYPKGSTRGEWLTAWERVAELRPDEPDGWYEAGDLLFHNPWLGTASDREGVARAKAFFLRAVERAPDYMPALQHLLQLAAHEGDTAMVRRILTAIDKYQPGLELRSYLQWRGALALGDSALTRKTWGRLQSGNLLGLQWLAMTSEEDGVALDEADAALRVRLRRASTDQERTDAAMALHALALNRGRLAEVAEALETLGATRLGAATARDIRVLDVLYGGVPGNGAASQAIAEMQREAALDPSTVSDPEGWATDRCVLGHWYLAHGGNADVDAQAAKLKRHASEFPNALWSDGARTCAQLLEAFVAVRTHAKDSPALLRSLEKALSSGAFMTSRLMWDVTAVASARLFEEGGDLASAEQAARRRNWYYRWPHYLATQLYELGRIAQQRGDTATAGDSYRHYLSLRAASDSSFKPEVARVSAAYRAIRPVAR
jgi:DNA-binding SARP family transcriptional activator/tetratricopeptide (TPR) repeat protein